MSKQPWMKFYPADWRADPCLRLCGLASRGLWIEMLSIMHESEPRGHLVINGKSITANQLSVLVCSTVEEVQLCLSELELNGVFSRKKNGVIFSRRIEKDEINGRKSRDNGKLGGNPSLCKQTIKTQSVNPLDKGGDKAQKLEARSQIKNKQKNCRFEEFWKAYPKKAGKVAAKKAWDKAIRDHEQQAIIDAAKAYGLQQDGKDVSFIKHPQGWLNDGRFLDPVSSIAEPVPDGFWRNPETGELKRTNRG